jgi:transcriptional regulator GlxA family with amidase domain
MEGTASVTRAARRALFVDAAAIIAAEYQRALTVDEVARRVATSPRQLQRVFAEVAGTSFSDHLREVRLARGRELLRRDPRTVAEIAGAVGYGSASAFSVAFRRRHGVPPGAVRD